MKKQFRIFSLILFPIFFSCTLVAQNPEQNISGSFDFEYKKQTVNDLNLAYYEQGSGDPVLFLHGIPESSYIWRNVILKVSKKTRAIALDLVGYGKSDLPKKGDYSIASHYQYIKGFIEVLKLKNITLVVTDIGSLYGLKYAIENPENVKSIVFIEAMFMPAEEWYKSLKMKQKMMFSMMQSEKMAQKMIVQKNKMPSMMLKMSTVSKPSDDIKNNYAAPYLSNIERRKVMLYGAGPHTVPKKGISQKPGDFADEVNNIAAGLIQINKTIPFLIIHASPGMIVRKKNLAYAKSKFRDVSFFGVGKGKHYLTEDHPTSIGDKIVEWMK